MNRRRQIQQEHNETHGITPQTIRKKISDRERHVPTEEPDIDQEIAKSLPPQADEDLLEKRVEQLRETMKEAAADLRFEDAATVRDEIRRLEELLMGLAS